MLGSAKYFKILIRGGCGEFARLSQRAQKFLGEVGSVPGSLCRGGQSEFVTSILTPRSVAAHILRSFSSSLYAESASAQLRASSAAQRASNINSVRLPLLGSKRIA